MGINGIFIKNSHNSGLIVLFFEMRFLGALALLCAVFVAQTGAVPLKRQRRMILDEENAKRFAEAVWLAANSKEVANANENTPEPAAAAPEEKKEAAKEEKKDEEAAPSEDAA